MSTTCSSSRATATHVDARPAAPYAWMLAAAVAFTFMGGFARSLAAECDWLWIAAARTFLAMCFAVACARFSGQPLVFLRPGTLWMRSLAGSVSLLCTFFALGNAEVKLADVYTLTNTFPLWVAILSWPLLRVLPSRDVWLAIAVGFVGVLMIQRPYFATGNVAALLALLSAISTAVAMIGLHRLGRIGPYAIVAHFSAVSFLCCLIGLAARGVAPPWEALARPEIVLQFLGLGLSATTGQVLLTRSFAAGAPARVSVVSLSQVGFAMLLEAAIWGREFDLLTTLGIVLVVAPTAWLLTRRDPAAAVAAAE